jgi:hypothetical protein
MGGGSRILREDQPYWQEDYTHIHSILNKSNVLRVFIVKFCLNIKT